LAWGQPRSAVDEAEGARLNPEFLSRLQFYWRQLRDMKGSAETELMAPSGLTSYAAICAWTLARAHARSGDPVAITAYLGTSDKFDSSITDFSHRYADQNERTTQSSWVPSDRGGCKPPRASEQRALDEPCTSENEGRAKW
jgi:hypothetical protein